MPQEEKGEMFTVGLQPWVKQVRTPLTTWGQGPSVPALVDLVSVCWPTDKRGHGREVLGRKG